MAGVKNIDVNSMVSSLYLVNEFERKKKYFEEAIHKLKKFSPKNENKRKNSKEIPPTTRQTRNQAADTTSPKTPNILSVKAKPFTPTSSPINQPHSSTFIFEQIQYLYDINLALLESVNKLQNDYQDMMKHNSIIEEENVKLRFQCNELKEKVDSGHIDTTNQCSAVSHPISPTTVDKLNLKITNLEQHQVNDSVIIQGTLLEDCTVNLQESNTANNLLNSVHKKLHDNLPTHNNDDRSIVKSIKHATVVNKNKHIIKLDLPCKNSKINLIKLIKSTKPPGLYISEFLVPERKRLFDATRLAVKDHRDIVDRINTRNGTIYYRESRTKAYYSVKSYEDLAILKNKLS